MGKPAFVGFLNSPSSGVAAEPGVHWGGEYASWSALLERGRERSKTVEGGKVYAVNPAAGLEAFAALFAVAVVADTALLWTPPDGLGRSMRELAPALYEADMPELGPERFAEADGTVPRPLWAVATSGSSGTPKLAVGYADAWELIALHYDQAVFKTALPEGPPQTLATCLPLKFSAAFLMTVLPAMFLRRDLVVFPAHDWTPVVEAGRREGVMALSVPALAAAACRGRTSPVDTPRLALLLGGGHLAAERVDRIRSCFVGAAVANLYGAAETGALCLDPDPGHNRHVGSPIPGKAVWLEGRDAAGIGAVAATGPDCCRATWRPDEGLVRNTGFVTGIDYGRFDESGHLCLEGRVDGAEKLMGVLVHPRATERHLLALPGVVDARVTVQRTGTGLEHLAARVVGAVSEDLVREHCATLPEAERPRAVECVAEDDITVYSAHGKL